MADRPTLSANALNNFSAYLPSGLTPDQAEKCIQAAQELAAVVWREGADAQIAVAALRREYASKPIGPTTDLSGWAEYFENWGSRVGDAPFTQEAVVKALRGPQPFGAGQPSTSEADR